MTRSRPGMTSRQRRTALEPRWNNHPLKCPLCDRWFPAATVRIVVLANRYVCHQCARRATGAHGTLPAPTAIESGTACATCHQPITGRSLINRWGERVHRACPRQPRPGTTT